jgi:hypothetical protein
MWGFMAHVAPAAIDARPPGDEVCAVEAAMPEAEVAGKRQDVGDYESQLAAQIVEMIRNAEADGERVLALVEAMMNLPVIAAS